MRHAPFNLLADEVERAVQVLHVRGPGDEDLLDVRFGLRRALPQDGGIDGDGAQVHQGEALAFNLFNHDAQNGRLLVLVLGQEDQAGAVFALLGHGYALQEDELMGNLEQDARPVAGLVVGSFGTAVLHVFQHPEGGIHQFVRLVAVNVDYHAHATGIVFVRRVIQADKSVAIHSI